MCCVNYETLLSPHVLSVQTPWVSAAIAPFTENMKHVLKDTVLTTIINIFK